MAGGVGTVIPYQTSLRCCSNEGGSLLRLTDPILVFMGQHDFVWLYREDREYAYEESLGERSLEIHPLSLDQCIPSRTAMRCPNRGH